MKHHINSFYDTKLPEATNEAYYRAERREGVLFRTHYRLVACAGAERGGRGGREGWERRGRDGEGGRPGRDKGRRGRERLGGARGERREPGKEITRGRGEDETRKEQREGFRK